MKSFTRDLIIWIEKNLDKNIRLEEVAARAGYSKWHLQRLFRNETGISLATYIRRRRLSESAVFLKMTDLPIVRVAELCGFEEQQAFTRAFSQHFGQPPGRYRRDIHWHFSGIEPSLLASSGPFPQPQTVWMNPPDFSGVAYRYQCPSDRLGDTLFHTKQRDQGLKKARHFFPGRKIICLAQHFEPSAGEKNICFYLNFSFDEADSRNAFSYPFISGERFLRFTFEGSSIELTMLQAHVYRRILPYRQEARRSERDFFIQRQNNHRNLLSSRLRGDYYVPVVADCFENPLMDHAAPERTSEPL